MIHYPCAPRSDEWRRVRTGLPTSSEFHRVVQPSSLVAGKEPKLSKQASSLICEKLCEWVIGLPIEQIKLGEGRPTSTGYMDRGSDLEDRAYAFYELETGTETEPGGFFTTDDGLYGASPDRCVGKPGVAKGGVELKAPAAWTHMAYLIERGVDEDHFIQIQGQMLVAEWEFVDVVSYHPSFPGVIIRVARNDEYCRKLDTALRAFCGQLAIRKAELEARGIKPLPPAPEADYAGDFVTDADLDAIIEARRVPQEA